MRLHPLTEEQRENFVYPQKKGDILIKSYKNTRIGNGSDIERTDINLRNGYDL